MNFDPNDPLMALLGGEPGPDDRALALQRQLGLLGQMSGDRVLAPVGQGLQQNSAVQGQQTQAMRAQRLRAALEARQQAQAAQQAQAQLAQRQAEQEALGQRQAQQAAQQAAWKDREFAAQEDARKADRAFRAQQLGLQGKELGLKQAGMEQDAWAFGQDPTGGGVMYNRKTGQVIPVFPQGAAVRPGQGTGLKPAQFESDVQSLGKDVEPIAKALPDIDILKRATAKEDVAGFGPVEGRVPNLLTSAEGVGNRQAAGRLMAAIIQAVSGQAASEKEVDRLLEANGMGRTATREQLQQGVKKLEDQYNVVLKQREAKYLPEVVQTYGERGGFTSKAAPAAAPGADALRKKYGL